MTNPVDQRIITEINSEWVDFEVRQTLSSLPSNLDLWVADGDELASHFAMHVYAAQHLGQRLGLSTEEIARIMKAMPQSEG